MINLPAADAGAINGEEVGGTEAGGRLPLPAAAIEFLNKNPFPQKGHSQQYARDVLTSSILIQEKAQVSTVGELLRVLSGRLIEHKNIFMNKKFPTWRVL